MEERAAASAAAGDIGDNITHGIGKKPKVQRYTNLVDKADQLVNEHTTGLSQMVELLKSIVSTPAAAAAAAGGYYPDCYARFVGRAVKEDCDSTQ